jgi:hypothetical protein
VSVNSNTGRVAVPPVMGKLPRPTGFAPEVWRTSIEPLPVLPLPNPLRSSSASM